MECVVNRDCVPPLGDLSLDSLLLGVALIEVVLDAAVVRREAPRDLLELGVLALQHGTHVDLCVV